MPTSSALDAISQTVFYNSHPTGAMNAGERLDALTEEGGIQVCGNAQNCVAVCPKSIPLTTSIARAGRAATVRVIKRGSTVERPTQLTWRGCDSRRKMIGWPASRDHQSSVHSPE